MLAATVAAAEPLGSFFPFIGAPAFALVLGMTLGCGTRPMPRRAACSLSRRRRCSSAVVLLGATFGLAQIGHIGRSSLPLMLGTLVIALVAAWFVGRALGVGPNLQTLVGVGTAICGASAIGAVSGVIGAAESEIAYAISTIFVFNVVAVVLYPALGHLLSLSQHTFGLWAGTAINDTSSVVAAAYTYGHTAGGVAVVTKLARTTMIIPIVLGLAAVHARRGPPGASALAGLPPFLVLFLLASALNTSRPDQPGGVASALARVATLLIAVALAAIGLSTRFAELRRTGFRPLLLGAVLWAVVGVTGLLLQAPCDRSAARVGSIELVVIDFHVHQPAAAADGSLRTAQPTYADFVAALGVELSAVFTFDGLRRPGAAANDSLARFAAEGNGRYVAFATVDPNDPEAAAEIARCVRDHGMRGVKLHPWVQAFSAHAGARSDLRGRRRTSVSPCSSTTGHRRSARPCNSLARPPAPAHDCRARPRRAHDHWREALVAVESTERAHLPLRDPALRDAGAHRALPARARAVRHGRRPCARSRSSATSSSVSASSTTSGSSDRQRRAILEDNPRRLLGPADLR